MLCLHFSFRYYQIRIGLKSFSNRVPIKVTCHPPKSLGKKLRSADSQCVGQHWVPMLVSNRTHIPYD